MMRRAWKSSLLLLLSAFLLLGCSLPGLSGNANNTVRIGTLAISESHVLGHIIRLMIEHDTDLNVEMIENLGSSIVQHKALTDNQVDITAVRYTGTDLSGVLGMEPVTDPDEAMAIVQREFEKRFNQTWFDSYGFSNTYAFTVTKELAKKNHLRTVSDVKNIAEEISLGVDNSWLKRKGDGYQGFIKAYGYEFGEAFPMQTGLVYQAVGSGKMDVVLAYSTDGRLKAFDLIALEDDKHFFPPYEGSPVANNDFLDKHPKVRSILEKLSGKISTDLMTELNYEADVLKKEPAIVAKEFLERNNYFE